MPPVVDDLEEGPGFPHTWAQSARTMPAAPGDYATDPGIPLEADQPVSSGPIPEDQPGPGLPITPPPPVMSSPAQPGPGPLILRGPQSPVTAPTGAPQPILSPEDAANQFMWRRLAYQVKDLPLAETEEAISAALRYQGMRQYQNDLAKGMNPGEALAKSAPLMFSNPKHSSLGQAASFVRATRPQADVVRDVGGVLYRYNKDGTATPLTPPKVVAPKVSEFDKAEYNSVLRQIQAVQKEADNDEIGSPEFTQHQATLQNLNRQLQTIRGRSGQASGGGSARVKVRRPDGKWGTIPADKLAAALAQGYTRQ